MPRVISMNRIIPVKSIQLPALVALVLALAAFSGCGDSDPERDQALVDAMVADILGEDDPLTSDEAEAECLATKTYDAIGDERMAAAGLTVASPDPSDADLTADEIDGVVDAVFDCVDVEEAFAQSMTGDGIDAEAASCMVDEFGDDGLRTLMTEGFTNADAEPSEEFIAMFTTAAAECGVPLG